MHLALVLEIYTLSCRSFRSKNFPILSQRKWESLESRTKRRRIRWRRPSYRINFDILAASQELNYYGGVCVMWVVHRTVNKEVFYGTKKLNNALRHSVKVTNNFVAVGSKLSSKNHRCVWLSLPEQFRTKPVKIYSSDKTEKRKEQHLRLLKNL